MAADSEKDPYLVLGIQASATARDVVRAYRRLARQLHPDSGPVDADSAARFRDVCDAYELLSDPARRASHDRQRLLRSLAPAAVRPSVRRPRPGSGVPPLWPMGPGTITPPPARVTPRPARVAAPPADLRLIALAEFVREFLGDDRDWL